MKNATTIKPKAKYIIGLTGLIGCGKSTVSQYFAKLGVTIIDTDLISHQLTQANGIAIKPIIANFGKEFINHDGSLDRVMMRNLVFSNKEKLTTLENILHPLIFNVVVEQLELVTSSYAIIVVPLLFKSNYLPLISRIIFIDCAHDILVARLLESRQLPVTMIETILKNQIPDYEQKKYADDIINNNGDKNMLFAQIKQLDLYYKLLC